MEQHSVLFDDEIRTNKQTQNECSILFTFRDFILIMYSFVLAKRINAMAPRERFNAPNILIIKRMVRSLVLFPTATVAAYFTSNIIAHDADEFDDDVDVVASTTAAAIRRHR